MLDAIWKYKHLIDPSATIRYTGRSGSAPSGKWALSDDPKTNMALWNTIGVSAAAIPATAALTLLANNYWDKWLRKKVTERSLSKINAMRPQMSPNDDLNYTYNITTKPRKELMRILERSDELTKTASDPSSESNTPTLVRNSLAGALPLVAAPVATYLTIRAVQDLHKRRLQKKLMEERTAIRNMQDKVDHEILAEQGIIKSAGMSVDEAEDIWERHGKDKDKESLFTSALTFPGAAFLGLSTIGGLIAYKKLSDYDKYKNRLRYLKDHILGANTLQDAPKISLAKFDKDTTSMSARPGDKVVTAIAESTPTKSLEAVLLDSPAPSKELTGLEEVTSTDLTPVKKPDALF